ncbi:TIGR02391 family protein [Diaminobutyricibacter sp. McL0608]|uniref:TIGR02391 family protein n=1 Tax=Leifsonia sp. McL0608 TaxID=3143537 RepID=UPI0031F2E021
MTGLNTEWALGEFDKFIEQTVLTNNSFVGDGIVSISNKSSTAASDADVAKQAQVVEQILDRVLPRWRTEVELSKENRWTRHREAAIRAREALVRQQEITSNLGDDAPEISAADLHPWVWGGARSLWQSGHFRSAVEDAAKKVNAETQNKLGRRDLSETRLFQEAFTEKPAEAGRPRLRRMEPDSSDTYSSVQRGAMAFAEGIYAGIRNPFNHEDPADIDKHVALEYLAALSVLARWVDGSIVETAS